MTPLGFLFHQAPSAEYTRCKLTSTQIIWKRIADHFVDRGDTYKRDAFSELGRAKDSLPEDIYLDLGVEHDMLSIQRGVLLDAAKSPSSEIISKARSYKNAAKTLYTTVHATVTLHPPRSLPSSTASSPIIGHAPHWSWCHDVRRGSTDTETFLSPHTTGDTNQGHLYPRGRREQSASLQDAPVYDHNDEDILAHSVASNEFTESQAQWPDLIGWLHDTLSTLDPSVSGAAVEDLLFSLPPDGTDDACRTCIADLMNEYGHHDGEAFVDEFIQRRLAAMGRQPLAHTSSLVSPEPPAVFLAAEDIATPHYSYYRDNTHRGDRI